MTKRGATDIFRFICDFLYRGATDISVAPESVTRLFSSGLYVISFVKIPVAPESVTRISGFTVKSGLRAESVTKSGTTDIFQFVCDFLYENVSRP